MVVFTFMEIWKTIKGYENYQISNLGNVKSLNYRRTNKEKTLILRKNTHGYKVCYLYINGFSKTKQVHQLVAIAFLNHTPCGYKLVVNHINFIKTDNRVENLEIVTSRENTNLKHIKSTSNYVGVFWDKNYKKWTSKIVINKKQKHLGRFIKEIDAHNAYQNELNKL
jgi:hypothetical protein